MVAKSNYGLGKIVAFTDSSPFDDSTGDVNDMLYNGYYTDGSGNHQKIIMNATYWLTHPIITTPNAVGNVAVTQFDFYPNPAQNCIYFNNYFQKIRILNLYGQEVATCSTNNKVDLSTLSNGVYILEVMENNYVIRQKLIVNR